MVFYEDHDILLDRVTRQWTCPIEKVCAVHRRDLRRRQLAARDESCR
jgi:hypothetical protein